MKRILFVDDEPRVLEGIQRMFRPQRKEWEMAFAKNGEEALELLERGAFDVVVTDMRMPGMDGGQLLDRVQERHPSVGRIVLSGHVELEAAMRAAPVAHQFRSKPCDPDQLRDAINRACESRVMLSDESVRSIIVALGRLPVLPSTSATLLHTLQEPDADLARVAQIVEHDVGITAKILQLVNSAFFGFHSEVTSVLAALNYLGLDTLKQLVLSVEIFRTFQPAPLPGFSLESFEAHSRLTARIAIRLPVPQRIANAATVAGLLHDVGELVLVSRLPRKFELALKVASERAVPVHQVEEEVIGTSHTQVGAYLLYLWGLPNSLVEAARGHHNPVAAEPGARQLDIVGVTHVADALAHEVNQTPDGDAPPGSSLLDIHYLEALGMADEVPCWRALARQVKADEV
jgi:HD-like signal output (HDOD) protein